MRLIWQVFIIKCAASEEVRASQERFIGVMMWGREICIGTNGHPENPGIAMESWRIGVVKKSSSVETYIGPSTIHAVTGSLAHMPRFEIPHSHAFISSLSSANIPNSMTCVSSGDSRRIHRRTWYPRYPQPEDPARIQRRRYAT